MTALTYVAFGDSITEGYGVKRNFVSILCEMIKTAYPSRDLKAINTGRSGDNSRDGLYRLKQDVLNYNPDLVTVNFGVNDAFSGVSAEQFRDNLEEIIRRIAVSGCERVVLLSCEAIPDKGAEREVLPFWEVMKRAAERAGCVYADVHGRWVREIVSGRTAEADLIIPGDMHPNEEGHRIIAEAVWEAIRASKILEEF